MDYEKFVNTLNKSKVRVLFTKKSGNIGSICADFEHKNIIGDSLIASITDSLDKEIKFTSWDIFSESGVDPEVYREIIDFALLKDDRKIIKLENCLDKK